MSARSRCVRTLSYLVVERGEVRRGPETVCSAVQIARVVARNRFEEEADPTLVFGESHTFTKQLRRIRRMTGNAQRDTGDVAKHRHRVVVVEVAAEALLVREAGDADHHRIPVLTVGEELERGCLTAYLIL